MSLTFLPSLQHLAAVKLAFVAYNDDIEHLFDEIILKEEREASCKIFPDGVDIIEIEDEYSERTFYDAHARSVRKSQKRVRRKLSTLLPKLLQNRVIPIIQPLVAEIYFWVRDHWYIIRHIGRSHCQNSLCWKSEGTIDRAKTAKQLVQNESIDKRIRFAMACMYFFENDILHLWHNLKASERKSIFSINSNLAVQFWVNWLSKRTRPPWTQFLSEYMVQGVLKRDHNRVRLSSFFIQLDSSKQGAFLKFMWPENVHFDDLHICYNLLDETGLSEIFHSYASTVSLLFCFLDWPLQSLFLDAVNHMKSHLEPTNYEILFRRILEKKIVRGMEDFDYLQLLKDFWDWTPDAVKERIQELATFTQIRAAISYDKETNRLPIQKFLKKCYDFRREMREAKNMKLYVSILYEPDF